MKNRLCGRFKLVYPACDGARSPIVPLSGSLSGPWFWTMSSHGELRPVVLWQHIIPSSSTRRTEFGLEFPPLPAWRSGGWSLVTWLLQCAIEKVEEERFLQSLLHQAERLPNFWCGALDEIPLLLERLLHSIVSCLRVPVRHPVQHF